MEQFSLTSAALLRLSGFAQRSVWAFAAGVGVHFVSRSASASCLLLMQDVSKMATAVGVGCFWLICKAGQRISSSMATVALVSLLLPWSPPPTALYIAYSNAIQNLQSLWPCGRDKFCEFQKQVLGTEVNTYMWSCATILSNSTG